MKVKPTPKPGRVVVEVDRRDEDLLAQSAQAPSKPPFALSKILVPIDFSDCSKKALQYALPLARQFGAQVTLLYVMPVNYFVGSEFGPVDFPLPEQEWRQNCQKELQALADQAIGTSLPVETLVRQGQAVNEVVSYAKEESVDLIVLSTHGRTGLRHVLVGSVTENVVRYASCPVLVVRGQEQDVPSASPQVPK
jgi:nucleotide-binding universal stress UspA family protein